MSDGGHEDREDRVVAWLRRRLRRAGSDPLGDDAAKLVGGGARAVSVDQQIEGVHFEPGLAPRLVGRRLVAVCLSDLAAMGAAPRQALLTVAAPSRYPLRRLLGAVHDACERHGAELVGGDLAAAPSLMLTLTVIGARGGRRWLERDAARAGDGLWVGGTLGESALGRRLLAAGAQFDGRRASLPGADELSRDMVRAGRRALRRHLLPEPQLELGRALARRRRVAAIDVSDGLALDLSRLCRESGVGAVVRAELLPLPARLTDWSRRLGVEPLDLALAGGEDYVLLFTLPRGRERPPSGCHRIGEITPDRRLELEVAGRRRDLPARGWDHLTAARSSPEPAS